MRAPRSSGDRVYVPSSDSRVVALRVDTGAPIWERRLGGAANDILASDDRLYRRLAGQYLLLPERRGWPRRMALANRQPTSSALPVVDERTVYFVSLDNVLRGARSESSGVQRWKSALPLRPTTGPLHAARRAHRRRTGADAAGLPTQDGKAAGEFAAGRRTGGAAPPLRACARALPMVIAVTRDIVKGATVVALTPSFDPAIVAASPAAEPDPDEARPATPSHRLRARREP